MCRRHVYRGLRVSNAGFLHRGTGPGRAAILQRSRTRGRRRPVKIMWVGLDIPPRPTALIGTPRRLAAKDARTGRRSRTRNRLKRAMPGRADPQSILIRGGRTQTVPGAG